MISAWNTYRLFLKQYGFQKNIEILALVFGGMLGSLFELLGISIVFPLISLMIQPERTLKNPIIARIADIFGLSNIYSIAVFLIIAIIAIYIIKAVFLLVYKRYELLVLARWRIKIASCIYDGFMRGKYEDFMNQSSDDIINNISVLVPYVVDNFIYRLINLLQIGLTAILLCGYVFYLSPAGIMLISLLGGVIIYSFVRIQRKSVRYLGSKMAEYSARQFAVLQQSIAGYKETKIYSKENFFKGIFLESAEATAINQSKLLFVQTLPQVIIELLVIAMIVFSFLIMLAISEDTSQSATQIALLVVLGIRFIPLLNQSITALTLINSASDAIDKLFKVHDMLEIGSPQTGHQKMTEPHSEKPLFFKSHLALESVTYRYHGESFKGIEDISLSLKPGDFIGITGPSGGGKTTLINVLLGFLTDFTGRYQIDDESIGLSNIQALRHMIGLVDQQPFILTGDFIDNVAFGEPRDKADRKRIEGALKKAQLWEFVQSNPEGLESYLGENGKLLSGGQRQRVAIARALYRDIKILILDEASSALDVENESNFFEYLETLKGSLTVIMIAHRLSTLKSCDRILFIDSGRLIDSGSFSQLYHSNPRFQKYVNYSNVKIHAAE